MLPLTAITQVHEFFCDVVAGWSDFFDECERTIVLWLA